MKKNALLRLLSLALVFCTVLPLCACPPAVDPGQSTTSSTQPGGDTPPETVIYSDGAVLADAGDRLAEFAPALTDLTGGDKSAATPVSADDLQMMFIMGISPDSYVLSSSDAFVMPDYSGELDMGGTVLYADGGVVFENANGLTLSNLTVIGGLSFTGASEIVLENVQVKNANGTALSISSSSDVTVENCRFEGKRAVESDADGLLFRQNVLLFTEYGLKDTSAEGSVIRDCRFTGSGVGISSLSSNANIMYNTLTLTEKDTGILVEKGSGVLQNAIVALNDITGAQESVAFKNVRNSVMLLNRVISVSSVGGRDVYIVENSMGGRIVATNNNYIIADANTVISDGKNHTAVQSGNQNTNGDALTDVNARAAQGVNEEILPHVDKDQFVGMAKTNQFVDYDTDTKTDVATYLTGEACDKEYVILAPGVYKSAGTIMLNKNCADTRIYAYGAKIERQGTPDSVIWVFNTANINIKGLTIGYNEDSCGQIYVLEKLGSNLNKTEYYVRVMAGAGMTDDFAKSGTSKMTNMCYVHRAGEVYSSLDIGVTSVGPTQADGTRIVTLHKSLYDYLETGDVMTCRVGGGERSLRVTYCSGSVNMTDVTIYGAAYSFAFHEEYNSEQNTYTRMTNTSRPAAVISEATYSAYRAAEITYGVSFDLSVDGEGRYRGSVPRIGSVDASHGVNNRYGSYFTSCLFENMCDDGTNQGGFHSRLDEVKDNHDGTLTLTYKGNCSSQGWSSGSSFSTTCHSFLEGDTVSVYTSEGKRIYLGTALEEGTYLGSRSIYVANMKVTTTGEFYSVKVDAEGFDLEWLQNSGLDLKQNNVGGEGTVLVDNDSWLCGGGKFDNVLVQNLRSRGLLIKSPDTTVENCTFRNVGMAAIALLYEYNWGESGVAYNFTVKNNIIDHAGYYVFTDYFKDPNIFSPITVWGVGADAGNEEYSLYENILIENNKISGRVSIQAENPWYSNPEHYISAAVTLRGAKNVVFKNNDFGTDTPELYQAIRLMSAANVELSGNLYPDDSLERSISVTAEIVRNVYGTDILEGEIQDTY